jgi:hypothetical protein
MFLVFVYSFRIKKSNFYHNNCDYFIMTTGNDMQFIPSNDVVQTDQPKSGIMTHQSPSSPSSYGQIDTQTMRSPNQNPTDPVYMYQNGQMIPVSSVNNGMSGPSPVARYPEKRRDYFNIVWSSCNIIFCGFILGIIALFLSMEALRMRRNGNDQNVRCVTICATIMNAIATIVGIIGIVLLILYYQNAL